VTLVHLDSSGVGFQVLATRALLSFFDTRALRNQKQEQRSLLFAPLSACARMIAMPSAPRTARALARAELTRAILDRARSQLGEVGPAALSVRQLARDLEMASSAVYRYFPSRDALLTALLIRAFDDLGQAVEDGDRTADRDDLRSRWTGLAHGLRSWAVAHPHEYALTYGSPIPGYAAPQDTIASATRVSRALLTLLLDAQDAGRSPAAPTLRPTEQELASIAPARTFVGAELDERYAIRGLMAWATLFGNISLELFGHLFKGVLDYDTHYTTLVEQLADDLGL
jgi:AcrR family transcriptional regulator